MREDIITTKQAADILNIQPATIHKYVKEGRLKPVYEDTWHIDSTKFFYRDDIERLRVENKKPGITTGEASELLGIHITTISQYIHKGLLKAEKRPYKGRNIYFIEPEEIERFKSSYSFNRKEQKDFFDKETGYGWYQRFVTPEGDSHNYILPNNSDEPFLHTKDGTYIPLKDIRIEGYQPVYQIPDIDYISKRGYAKFKFSLNRNFFIIMEIFYKNLGHKNIKIINCKDEGALVEVKPFFINEMLDSGIIKELNNSLFEGNIIIRHNGLYIDSDLEIISVAVPSKVKELVKKEADRRGKSIEELVLQILNEKLKK